MCWDMTIIKCLDVTMGGSWGERKMGNLTAKGSLCSIGKNALAVETLLD